MTKQEYRQLIEKRDAAGQILDYVRSDRNNFCLPPNERPSDEELEQAEEQYAEFVRVVNAVRSGFIKVSN
jgi:hypothetical protein